MGGGALGSAFDVARARRDTPGCAVVSHFNNAGSALTPTPVLDAVIEHLRLEARIGGYEAAEAAVDAEQRFYTAAARLLNCAPDEVAFTDSATRAWDLLFYSLVFHAGDRILTTVAEYASNYIAYLQVSRRSGVSVEVIPNEESGELSIAGLRGMIDEHVKLISITHVPTNGGLVNPAAEVGRVAREAHIPYLLDACQSVGQMPIDVEEIGCDFLSSTGRKYLRGPRGTGLLYARREALEAVEPIFLDLHSATWVGRDDYQVSPGASRFETWEVYHAGRCGLGRAIEYALEWGIDAIWQRVTWLAERLRHQLKGIAGVTVTDIGAQQCGIVTFMVAGQLSNSVKVRLYKESINVSVSVVEHTRLDMESRLLPELVRASVHYYNTVEEIDALCLAVGRVAR